MSWSATAARSSRAPVTAILNLRGKNANSGWNVDHCRRISQYGRGSSISSFATPANGSLVMLRMQLPLVWIACISTLGELFEDVRDVLELRPVVLDVLPRREVAVALVVDSRDVRELSELRRREQPVRDRHAQHVRVELHVETVLQPKRLELVLADVTRDAPAHLILELARALLHEEQVVRVVAVHRPHTS